MRHFQLLRNVGYSTSGVWGKAKEDTSAEICWSQNGTKSHGCNRPAWHGVKGLMSKATVKKKLSWESATAFFFVFFLLGPGVAKGQRIDVTGLI
jgi:hypothetical protein